MTPVRISLAHKYLRTILLGTAFIWLLSGAFLSELAKASEPSDNIELTRLVVDNQKGLIKVRFGLDINPLTPLELHLNLGETLTLICEAKLSAIRDYWVNQTILEKSFNANIYKNISTGEYTIFFPLGRRSLVGNDLHRLIAQAFKETSITLGPWDTLWRNQRYKVSLQISLVRKDRSAIMRLLTSDVLPSATYHLDFLY